MLHLVPAPRQDELLYSALARAATYLQVPEAGPFMSELLGRRSAIASVALPGHLAHFVREVVSEKREAAIDRLIDGHTLFPFHTAFMPKEVRTKVRQAMRGDVTGVFTRLGLATFKVRPPGCLRFCPVCFEEMVEGHGDAWWRRDHQLPGILVCPAHGEVLRLSDVDPGDINRHRFMAASRETCCPDAPLAVTAIVEDDLAKLWNIARLASRLLTEPPPPTGFVEQSAAYRERLAEVGLMRSARKVDHAALVAAFRARWGRVTELVPGLDLAADVERSWLSSMVRTGRRASHPLQHLMLQTMLCAMDSVPNVQLFGPGPWLCRNPVADHYGMAVVASVSIRQDRATTYGDFACECGYLYTCSRSPDGVIGDPKFRAFGPLLAPSLRAAIERGDGLRQTARMLGLDPKTLMREAAIAGVNVPWNTGASGRLPRAGMPKTGAPSMRPRRPARVRRNWFAIDTRLARSVRHVAILIRSEIPPVRVTAVELERRVARRDWVSKRRDKLPQTVAALATCAEGRDEFRSRRLDWQLECSFADGVMRPCEILRRAGLPMCWLPRVREAIDGARRQGRAIA